MSDSDKTNEIEINLNKKTGVFAGSEIIHKDEFNTLKEIILSKTKSLHIPNSSSEEYMSEELCSYDNILINGSRGSGKTSFLNSVAHYFKKNPENEDEIRGLYVLPYFDPTLIEEKAHVFLTVISFIKTAVEERLNKENENIGKRKDWNDKLTKLAKGLPMIDGTSRTLPDYWDDASQIMHKGIEDTNAAFYLRDNFNSFVASSLHILSKKAFLLIIDDVDTNFAKAWPVMEMLRKYVCNNKIIVIVSGDFKLLSLAVRKQQLSNFRKEFLNNDCDCDWSKRALLYQRQILDLENQYLKKLFPVENRINLPTLKELLKNQRRQVFITYGNSNKKTPEIKDFYNGALEKYGIKEPYQRSSYINFLESLPLRTQIQLMRLFHNAPDNGDTPQGIVNAFITELQYHDIDTTLLVSNKNFFTILLLKFLVNNKHLFDFYQIEPISGDNGMDSTLMTFSLLLSLEIKNNPIFIINYFIRICYIRNLIPFFDSNEYNNESFYNLERLIKHSGAYSDSDLRQTACYIISFMRSVIMHNVTNKSDGQNSKPSNLNEHLPGTIVLPGLAKTAKGTKDEKKDAFDAVMDNLENPLKKFISYMPFSVDTKPTSNRTINEYSFFTLLAAIYDVICEVAETGCNRLGFILAKYEDIRHYPLILDATMETAEENDADSGSGAKPQNSHISYEDADLTEAIKLWISCSQGITVSSYVLAKIFTRTYSVLRNMEKQKKNNLGEAMHLFTCAFLNSCIIEESQESKLLNPRRDNILTSDSYFGENLKKTCQTDNLTNLKNSFPVFNMFAGCPFLLCFLNLQSRSINESLKKIVDDKILDVVTKLNIYKDLCKVSVSKPSATSSSNGETSIEDE